MMKESKLPVNYFLDKSYSDEIADLYSLAMYSFHNSPNNLLPPFQKRNPKEVVLTAINLRLERDRNSQNYWSIQYRDKDGYYYKQTRFSAETEKLARDAKTEKAPSKK